MTTPTSARAIARQRLAAQLLVGPAAASAVDVVRHLGAVQSQEFGPARWSLGQRSGVGDADVLAAYDRGEILRTHVLRPTWHFVLPEDLGWMQRLTSGRVRNQATGNARRAGIDEQLTTASFTVLADALVGGRDLNRVEIQGALATAGIEVNGQQLGHVTLLAELHGILTSGPVRGSLRTFMLLEERVTDTRELDGEEALAELTLRYFRSHGPASEKDLAWWASLPLVQVRRGIQALGDRLEAVSVDDVTYWFDPSVAEAEPGGALMLQTFDECLVAYTQTRKVAYQALPDRSMNPNSFDQPILVDGQVVGTWRRGSGKSTHVMRVALPAEHDDLLEAELARYAGFLGVAPFEVDRVAM